MAPRKLPKRSPTKVVSATDIPGIPKPASPQPTASPPARVHGPSYHYPLLFESKGSSDALLSWFEGIAEVRNMPWRKRWIDPKGFGGQEKALGEALSKRAYEVWVSEIMLQQTRVSTVIPYFNNWITKWPTVQDLAKASHDDVLSAWKGLGYYSRATRLHEGAQTLVSNSAGACLIPNTVEELLKVPGIGRYTAGAVSSIAFGEPEPVLDGNVARVLSRQLGLYIEVKDKQASDMLWDAADRLVKHVSENPDVKKSAIPGQWNQAVMELGSTICTPRPKCDECPIQKTCRAFAEGRALSEKKQSTVLDIEDTCKFCEQLDTEELVRAPEDEGVDPSPAASRKRKREPKVVNTISSYFTNNTSKKRKDEPLKDESTEELEDEAKTQDLSMPAAKLKSIASYCSLFPKKIPKKKVAEQDCAVCMIEAQVPGGKSKWLIEQRPAKGLLASLWQFPQTILSATKTSTAHRKTSAQEYVSSLDGGHIELDKAKHIAAPDSLVHVFSHLKLTMHVHVFRVQADKADHFDILDSGTPARKWVDTESMDDETLSTGMRRCWDLVRSS